MLFIVLVNANKPGNQNFSANLRSVANNCSLFSGLDSYFTNILFLLTVGLLYSEHAYCTLANYKQISTYLFAYSTVTLRQCTDTMSGFCPGSISKLPEVGGGGGAQDPGPCKHPVNKQLFPDNKDLGGKLKQYLHSRVS